MNFCRTMLLFCLLTFVGHGLPAQLTYKELLVEYDSAWIFKNLKIVPIKFKSAGAGVAVSRSETVPISLSEGLQKHKVKLHEVEYQNGADVNWLKVTNHSKQNVLIQSGEIVGGGKQDRMMGETKMIGAGQSDFVHVYCVEKRRWDDKPKDFGPAGEASSELRKVMDVTNRQSAIWKEIDHQLLANKKTGDTWAYRQLYKDSIKTDTAYMNYFRQKYVSSDSNFAGFMFIIGNHIISCELFSSSRLTNLCYMNMLSSYVHSVVRFGGPPTVSYLNMKEFMDKILTSESLQKTFVTAHGKIHYYEAGILHLIAYGD